MKIKKGAVIGITVIILIVIGVAFYAVYERNKDRGEFAQRIISQGGGSMWDRPDSIEELKTSIATYEKRINRYVEDAAKTGTYWKLLAARLQERGLHGEALDALQHAIYYSPEDPLVQYYTGISAGIMAKSVHDFPGKDDGGRKKYFALAEDSFLRAIDLDSRYLRPRYSLGVLYVFDLNRPQDAIPHLERCLEISRNDVDTMFVLARAHFMLKNYQAALDLYDRIITLTTDAQKRTDAQNNRQMVLGQMHG